MRKFSLKNVEVDSGFGDSMVRLGSPHGGWWVDSSQLLDGMAFLSVGVGEDISFDVELVSRTSGTAFLMDPTPRAQSHVDAILDRVGQANSAEYSKTGKQVAAAYDLRTVSRENLVLLPQALWVHSGSVKFLAPENPQHVSYSIHRKLSSATKDHGNPISVATVNPVELRRRTGRAVGLIKLDIEGAETHVLPSLLRSFPEATQLLIEFDVFKTALVAKNLRVRWSLRLLRQRGFRLAKKEGRNLTFVRSGESR